MVSQNSNSFLQRNSIRTLGAAAFQTSRGEANQKPRRCQKRQAKKRPLAPATSSRSSPPTPLFHNEKKNNNRSLLTQAQQLAGWFCDSSVIGRLHCDDTAVRDSGPLFFALAKHGCLPLADGIRHAARTWSGVDTEAWTEHSQSCSLYEEGKENSRSLSQDLRLTRAQLPVWTKV